MAGDVKVRITGEDKGAQDTIKRTERAISDLDEAVAKLARQEQQAKLMEKAKESLSKMTEEEKKAAIAAANLTEEHKETARSTEKLKTETEKATPAFAGLADGIDNAVQELTGFSLSQLSVAGAIAGLGVLLKDSVMGFSDYATQVEKYARATGVAEEEASRLIQTADDFQVEVGSLESAMKLALQNGFVPTIENLATLADQYQATVNPAERAEMMSRIFGRSWTEIAPLFDLGGQAIRDNAAAISEHMIITGEASEQNKAFKRSQDALKDTWTGFTNQIGQAIIPGATDLLNVIVRTNENYDEMDNYGQKLLATFPLLGPLFMATAAQQELLDEATEKANAELEAENEKADDLPVKLDRVAYYSNQVGENSGAMSLKVYEAARAMEQAKADALAYYPSLDTVMASTQKLTDQILFQKMAQGLNAEAALELGRSMGVINELSYTMQSELEKLKSKFDLNRDGAIDASEATADYEAALRDFAGVWNALQDKNITLTVTTVENVTSNIGAQERQYNIDLNGNGVIGAKYGADFDVPDQPRYANDGMLMRVSAGEHVTVTPSNQAQGGSKPGGNTYIYQIFTKENPGQIQNALTLSQLMGGAA